MKSRSSKRNLIMVLVLAAVIALISRDWQQPQPSAHVSPEREAEMKRAVEDAAQSTIAAIENAPNFLAEQIRDGHPYHVINDLKTINLQIERINEIQEKLDEIAQKEAELETDSPEALQLNEQREALFAELMQIVEELSEL